MIITRSPLRISYLGGGTDFPEFYFHDFGCSIASTIDKYVYVITNALSDTSSERIRLSYSSVESCNTVSQIQHPVFREVLSQFQHLLPVAISTFSDVPARNGLGGSSAFTASLYKNMLETSGQPSTSEQVARFAIEIERDKLGEIGGHQDQYQTSFGGFNFYLFKKNSVEVRKDIVSSSFLEFLRARQLLIYSGYTRTKIPKHKDSSVENTKVLESIRDLTVATFESIEENSADLHISFNFLRQGIDEYWKLKERLSQPESEELFKEIRFLQGKKLDFSYKLLGAGGGGFFLVLAEEQTIELIKNMLPSNRWIQPGFSKEGTEVVETVSGVVKK
jgi:D-glycero-alpha-D-manno-heptose-7-phosphate kinase